MDERIFKQSGKTLTSRFQREVLAVVSSRGVMGVTDAELQKMTGKGHGSTSSTLSTLHKNGYLARLKERRMGNTVYVHTQYVLERPTLPPMTNTGDVSVAAELRAENKALLEKIEKVAALVEPGFRSYSYTREHLMDDIRRALL
jgi:hypothetical protein